MSSGKSATNIITRQGTSKVLLNLLLTIIHKTNNRMHSELHTCPLGTQFFHEKILQLVELKHRVKANFKAFFVKLKHKVKGYKTKSSTHLRVCTNSGLSSTREQNLKHTIRSQMKHQQ